MANAIGIDESIRLNDEFSSDLAAIADEKSGAILFLGIIGDPKE